MSRDTRLNTTVLATRTKSTTLVNQLVQCAQFLCVFLQRLRVEAPMSVTTRLHGEIVRALCRLRLTRSFCSSGEETMTRNLNNLLEHVAARPLAEIDPELDRRLSVHRCGRI